MNDFKMAQPQNARQAAALLEESPQNTLLMAGGTDLLDEIKNQVRQPEMVVDMQTIPGLDFIQQDRDSFRIGALTSVAQVADHPELGRTFPVLQQAALSLATPQLRNVGTVGGNLCQRPRCWYYRDPQVTCRKKGGSRCYAYNGRNRYHAVLGGRICYIVHPSDLAPALLCLDAEVTIADSRRERRLPLGEFYALPSVDVRRETVLEPGELVTEVRIPIPRNNTKSAYLKIKERGTWDFAVVSAAVNVRLDGGVIREVKLVCGGVAPIPWRMSKAEAFLKGKPSTEANWREAVRRDLADARPLQENAYKLDLLEAAVYRTGMSLTV